MSVNRFGMLDTAAPMLLPVTAINFGDPGFIMPHELPPVGINWREPVFDKLNNIPGQTVFTLYHNPMSQYGNGGKP